VAQKDKKNKRISIGRRGAFQRIINRVSQDWRTLAKASQQLPAFRTNFVAHLILEYDEPTNRFRIGDIPRPKELYETIEKLIPIITRSVANLAIILGIGADRLNLFGYNAKKNAAIFWDLKTASRD